MVTEDAKPSPPGKIRIVMIAPKPNKNEIPLLLMVFIKQKTLEEFPIKRYQSLVDVFQTIECFADIAVRRRSEHR